MKESLADVCLFLTSSYGKSVGNFIYQVSHFIATISHPDIKITDYGNIVFQIGRRYYIFVAEKFRINTDINFNKVPNTRIKKLIPHIASTLVAHMILKWRSPSKSPNLIGTADEVDINIHKNSEITSTTEHKKNISSKREHLISEGVKDRTINSHSTPLFQLNTNKNQKTKQALTKDTTRTNNSKLHIVNTDDQRRIIDLIAYSKTLGKPSNNKLTDKESVISWCGRANPLEAYFLAALLTVTHLPPEFSDWTLNLKLSAWIKWAKSKNI